MLNLHWSNNVISKDLSSERSDTPPSELQHLHHTSLHFNSNRSVSAQARINPSSAVTPRYYFLHSLTQKDTDTGKCRAELLSIIMSTDSDLTRQLCSNSDSV